MMSVKRLRSTCGRAFVFLVCLAVAQLMLLAFVGCAAPESAAGKLNARQNNSTANQASQNQSPQASAQQNVGARTPSDTVRDFYKLLRERRFREALALSIFEPAIKGLSDAELNELRTELDAIGADVPADLQVTGEQISNDLATVFVKLKPDAQPVPVELVKEKDVWLVGNRENQKIVRERGSKFFSELRVEAHHAEAEMMMRNIAESQIAYMAQHNTTNFADLTELNTLGFIPKGAEMSAWYGYKFTVTVSADRKSYVARAEPLTYGVSGRLSFYMDNKTALKSKDTGGKPYKP